MTHQRRLLLASLLAVWLGMVHGCGGGEAGKGQGEETAKPAPNVGIDEASRREAEAKAERKRAEEAEVARKGKEEVDAADRLAELKVKRDAAIKLVDTRKAELAKAKEVFGKADLLAKQARATADLAVEKAAKDYRTYEGVRRTSRVFQEYAREDLQASRSKQEAKEAVRKAKEYEQKASQASKVVDEVQVAVRRAEEVAINTPGYAKWIAAEEQQRAEEEKRRRDEKEATEKAVQEVKRKAEREKLAIARAEEEEKDAKRRTVQRAKDAVEKAKQDAESEEADKAAAPALKEVRKLLASDTTRAKGMARLHEIVKEYPRSRKAQADLDREERREAARLVSDEKAEIQLKYVKKLIDRDMTDKAKERLKEIIREYPESATREEAKKLLKTLD